MKYAYIENHTGEFTTVIMYRSGTESIPDAVIIPKGLFANNLDKIALRFGADLVVATSAKPQA
nr:hypothetical protein [uncultured Desulfobulbus sp.]